MPDHLLEIARQQAEKANPSMRAAALLRIARVESAADVSRARRTLLEILDVIRNLPSSVREQLLEEARAVAAAVSPALLGEIPITRHGPRGRFASVNLVLVMLVHGHVDAAFDYLLHHEDTSFPFPVVVMCFISSIGSVRKVPTVGAPPGAGTEVDISVPAVTAYLVDSRKRRWGWLGH